MFGMTALPLPEALDRGVVVLDGGLATRLEARGHDLSGGLWSARLLLSRDGRAQVAAAHRDFFAAGAQVATTASYQLSRLSMQRAGHDPDRADELLRASVEVARAVRDEVAPDGWVVGSVGPYGASLADGSEYTGAYGLGGDHGDEVAALRAFHRPRIEALVEAGADALAAETVPCAAEAEALSAELAAAGLPAWISLTPAPGGLTTRRGEPLVVALEPTSAVMAVGVNCCAPDEVLPALELAAAVTGRPGVAYPNSGERWDAAAQRWWGETAWEPAAVRGWVAAGARLVGGCCRVGPDEVAPLAALART